MISNDASWINIILPNSVGQDPTPKSVSRKKLKSWWETELSRAVEVRQMSLTSISTSESVCGLSVVHPWWRSDAVWDCCADARLLLPTVMRACGGASVTPSEGRSSSLSLYIGSLSRRGRQTPPTAIKRLRAKTLKVRQEIKGFAYKLVHNNTRIVLILVFLSSLLLETYFVFATARLDASGRSERLLRVWFTALPLVSCVYFRFR